MTLEQAINEYAENEQLRDWLEELRMRRSLGEIVDIERYSQYAGYTVADLIDVIEGMRGDAEAFLV